MMRSLKLTRVNELNCSTLFFLLALFVGYLLVPNTAVAADGDLIWFKTYNLDEDSDVTEILGATQTSDGGYILTGSTRNYVNGDNARRTFLIKTDANGDSLWSQIYCFHDYVHSLGRFVFQTEDGGYLLIGDNRWCSEDFPSGLPLGVFVIKTDDVGDTLWTRVYDREYEDSDYHLTDICQTSDGGYAISGLVTAGYWGFVKKIDADCNEEWTQIYEPTHSGNAWDNLYIRSLDQTTDGGYILAGQDQLLSGFGYADSGWSYLTKTDSAGDTLWTSRVNGVQDNFECVCQAADGGYICGGSDEDYDSENHYGYFEVTKVDSSGNEEWAIHPYCGTDTSGLCFSACAITTDSDCEYLISCFRYYYFGEDDDYMFQSPVLMRIDNDGNIVWSHSYAEEFGEEFEFGVRPSEKALQITSEGNYLICGKTKEVVYNDYVASRQQAFLALIEGTATDIDDSYSLPQEVALAQNYPNPFNMSTVISYDLNHTTDVQLDVYDILGRKVTTLVDESQQAGSHTITWNAEDVASGIYFYKIQADDFTDTKQMLLIK